MKQQHTLVKALPIAVIVSFVATRRVRGRFEDETFVCDTGAECELGSSLEWLLTGITSIGPFIAVLGFMWSRRLHHQDRLGPFSYRAIPDVEQILEVLGVLAAAGATYWLMLNGPSIGLVSTTGDQAIEWLPTRAAEWLREFRAPDVMDAEAREKLTRVPSRRTWFFSGLLLGAPFMFSLGSMLGREWYGRKRRKAQREAGDAGDNAGDTLDLTNPDESSARTSLSGRSTIDLTKLNHT